jgi:hypothetical protein
MGAGNSSGSIIRFFVDESVPEGVRKSLALTRDDVTYPGHPSCPVVRGVKDEQWLPIVGTRDWIVILRDRQIRYRQREREAFMEARVEGLCTKTSWKLHEMGGS